MKKIKEGLINEEIVRRYSGSDNGRNNVVDKGKGGGSRSHDYEKVIADELGTWKLKSTCLMETN